MEKQGVEEKLYLNQKEVSRVYGISTKVLEQRRQKKQGPRYFTFGKAVRYRVADLDAFMEWHEPKADKV